MSAASRKSPKPLALALAIYAATTLVFAVTMGSSRLTTHTSFNHFALQAEAWTHGRLDLGGPPPAYAGNNDFAIVDGKTFVSFPPFPAVLITPLVWLLGSAEKTPDGLFFLGFAGLGPAILFIALERLSATGRSPRNRRENVALALSFAFGTIYWFTAVQGTVWFAAHVVGVALASLYLLFSIDAAAPELAGLSLALGFATRTPLGFALPLFLFEALRLWRAAKASPKALVLTLVRFALPCVVILALLCWNNQKRFGSPLEFGHRLLAIGWRGRIERWGLFSYHYLGRNLAVVLTSLPFTGVPSAPFQINAHGLALWLTTPIYAWAFWPKKTDGFFWALAATAASVALPSLLYQNSGWIQFGYRFSSDFAPFLFAMIAVGARPMRAPFWVLASTAVVVNGFGAFTFQRAGFERYYFVDGTQRVLHQPD